MKHLQGTPVAGRTVLITGATSTRRIPVDGLERTFAVNQLAPFVFTGAEDPARIQRLLIPFLRPVMRSPARGAATSIHLVSAPELQQVSGRYVANRRPEKSSAGSYDLTVAERLWVASADLVGRTAARRV